MCNFIKTKNSLPYEVKFSRLRSDGPKLTDVGTDDTK